MAQLEKAIAKSPSRLFRPDLFALFSIMLVGFLALYFISNFNESHRVVLPESYNDADVGIKAGELKGFLLGGEGLIADVYWMNSLQYIGDKMVKETGNIDIGDLSSLNARLLYPYLDAATTLDPHFMSAYSYGASVLPAINAQQAIALTQKGIDNNPTEWRLCHYLGYIYWRMGDYTKAAEIYKKGSEMPGAASFMKVMAATMTEQGGSRETARAMYQQMLAEAQDEQTKLMAENKLSKIISDDEVAAINETLDKFKSTTGRCASNFAELLPLLTHVKLPATAEFKIDSANNVVDPSGAAYVLNNASCTAGLDAAKTKIALK